MIKQFSPLRYPGGKAQLDRFFCELLSKQNMDSITYIEPFAGGAGLALSLLFSNHVQQIIINDFDKAIYAVWYAILNHTDEFITKLEQTEISIDQWYNQKDIYMNKNIYSLFELGFATFFLNRTNRSGIIKGGVIGGKKQDGIYKLNCRFNKNSLIERIRNISDNKHKIQIYNLDVIDFIHKVISICDKDRTFIFFDPPYYKKGQDLYTNFFLHENHKKLIAEIETLCEFKWITTYDECDEIKEMFSKHQGFCYNLNYSLAVKRKATELMFYNENLEDVEQVATSYLNISHINQPRPNRARQRQQREVL